MYFKTNNIYKVGTNVTINSAESTRGIPTDTTLKNEGHLGNIKNQSNTEENKDSNDSSSNESAIYWVIEKMNIAVHNMNTIEELNQ